MLHLVKFCNTFSPSDCEQRELRLMNSKGCKILNPNKMGLRKTLILSKVPQLLFIKQLKFGILV